jgi:WD40 repeat protein
VAFARDGKRIASASADQSVIIWDAATGRKETTLVGHATRVSGLAFAPGGDWLASVDGDGNIIIWDLAQRQLKQRFNFPKEWRDTHCLAISPDGRWVAVSHGVYESATGRQVVGFHHYGAVGWQISASGIYGVSFSVDGRWMVLAEAYGKLLLWDTATWQVADRANIAPSQLISVSFSPDGKQIVSGERDHSVRLYTRRRGLWGWRLD